MVPAESMMNLESRPLFLTISLKTPSAAGLRQMLPRQTKRTEKGLVSLLCVGVAIGEDDAKHLNLGFSRKLETRFGFFWQGRIRNRDGWQNGK